MTPSKNTKLTLAFLCVFALGLLAGGFGTCQYQVYKTIQTTEATTQLALEGQALCGTLGQAMAAGDQSTLKRHYQEMSRSDPELWGYVAQRLSVFDGLPLLYTGCQEVTCRGATPTAYSGTYDLFFQVQDALPQAFLARLPDYASQEIQATGRLTVTIYLAKEEGIPWAYSLSAVQDIVL